jgi:hypothetical protein
MKRDVLFLGMDIIKEAKKLHIEFKNTITDGMNEAQLTIYNKGVEDMLYCVGCLLDREHLSDEQTFVVNIEDLEMQTEFFKRDLFKLADKRDYNLPECE